MLWTSEEAAAATGGRATRAWTATGVSIDSRAIVHGDLFVALTDKRDGHDFVADALAKGAVAALVTHVPEGVGADAPLLIVEDVQAALEALGRAGRARSKARVAAVTGSVGKTSTKEMLRRCLGTQGKVHASESSYNNHWGVPLTLARLPRDADFAVIEIGMNAPGEIAPLARMARPHVAMITNVEAAHLGAFRTMRGIAREKASIVEGLEPGGVAVLNRDTKSYPILSRRAKLAGAEQLRFGMSGRPEYRMGRVKVSEGRTVVIAHHKRKRFTFKLGVPGKHLAMNALGALAVVEALGAERDRAALELIGWRPPAGRGVQRRIQLGPLPEDGIITLIDDAYNANPSSMLAALDVLAEAETRDGMGRVKRGRRIAVLGDMLELGDGEADLHAALAAVPSMARVDTVHTVGPLMENLQNALPPSKRGKSCATAEELASSLPRLLDAGDVVLVKASLGTGLAPVVDAVGAMGKTLPDSELET